MKNEFSSLQDFSDAIKKATTITESENGFSGLFLSSKDSCVFDYGRNCLSVTGKIRKMGELYESYCSISSIDDSGVTLFGPQEKEDKAKNRLNLLKVNLEKLNGVAPTKEELGVIASKTGYHPDFW